jgi:hypothetical protein
MIQIEILRKNRFTYLHHLYKKSSGSTFPDMNMWEIGRELGFGKEKTENITDYLENEGLLKYTALGGTIAITHPGIVEVEEALSHPEEPTQYFPPVNVINIHHMESSQIQQGASYSTQSQFIDTLSKNDILAFIESLKGNLYELELEDNEQSEISADISTIEAQLSSSRPKRNILKECLTSIQRILEGAAGSIVAQQLFPLIPPLLRSMQ